MTIIIKNQNIGSFSDTYTQAYITKILASVTTLLVQASCAYLETSWHYII